MATVEILVLALSLFFVVLLGFGVVWFRRWVCFVFLVDTISGVFMMLTCEGLNLFPLFLIKFK